MFTFYLLYNKSFNLCGRISPEIPFHTRRTIIKLSQAGNSQRKRVKDLSVSHAIVQTIIKKFQNTGFVRNIRLRSRKPRRTILETNRLLRLVKSKSKRTYDQSLTITELRNFLKLELEITGEEMGAEKRVLKKNNLNRPANRKTLMLFCQEKRNWTKGDLKKLLSSDETMVVIKNGCKIQLWGKSDKKNVPHLICCEDKKRVAVMFWGCVSSRSEKALIPVLDTIDSVKYIDIF